MSTVERAETSPMVNYLAYDCQHITLPVLVGYLDDIAATLRDGQSRAYEAGQEDWSNEFAEALDVLMDIMPGDAAREKAAAMGKEAE